MFYNKIIDLLNDTKNNWYLQIIYIYRKYLFSIQIRKLYL